MIERLIFAALEQGIAALNADPEAIVRFFCNRGLTVVEANKIKETWKKDPPTVIHNYPRSDAEFPLFAVVLGNEDESIKALDDFGGFVDAETAAVLQEAALQGTVLLSSIYDHQHHVMVYTEHADVTIYYYQLAKFFLTRERDFFKEEGLLDTKLGGHDMKPDPNYAPEWLFVRRLTMSSKKESIVFDDDKLPTIRTVQGAWVNNPDAADGDVILPTGVEPAVSVGVFNTSEEEEES